MATTSIQIQAASPSLRAATSPAQLARQKANADIRNMRFGDAAKAFSTLPLSGDDLARVKVLTALHAANTIVSARISSPDFKREDALALGHAAVELSPKPILGPQPRYGARQTTPPPVNLWGTKLEILLALSGRRHLGRAHEMLKNAAFHATALEMVCYPDHLIATQSKVGFAPYGLIPGSKFGELAGAVKAALEITGGANGKPAYQARYDFVIGSISEILPHMASNIEAFLTEGSVSCLFMAESGSYAIPSPLLFPETP